MTKPATRKIDLALQGGGSHGAFTWGVLDRLLEDERPRASTASRGTSAGALNAAVLATGLARGGRDGAREALRDVLARRQSRAGTGFAPLCAAAGQRRPATGCNLDAAAELPLAASLLARASAPTSSTRST